MYGEYKEQEHCQRAAPGRCCFLIYFFFLFLFLFHFFFFISSHYFANVHAISYDAFFGKTNNINKIPKNKGASIPSMNLVCFYSLKVSGRDSVKIGEQHSAAMCYHTVQQRWHAFDCTVPHDGGQVVAMGPLLLVAGGAFPTKLLIGQRSLPHTHTHVHFRALPPCCLIV